MKPREHFKRIEGLVDDSNILYNNNKLQERNDFGIEFKSEMLELEGRSFQKPQVYLSVSFINFY